MANTPEHSVEMMEVSLVSSNEKQGVGKVEVLFWAPPERTRRALKTLGIFWGAAIISVILPLVHFVLVPGFLLGGPIAAFFAWAQQAKILSSSCVCPSCSTSFQIKGAPNWPMSQVCSNCHEGVRITPRQELRPNGKDPQL
jgi:hypothetical protein